ncbi:MAG TPA: RES family NAD+ phosphorylase [Pyrinomonadaceae bacterium]|nr:RES family NAD+ phosphorylase [Pyrinomonadaceae bacterium]
MTRAWRIVKTRFWADAFSGEGARVYGGRWNSSGVAMVYTAGSISLATLELLVHLDTTLVIPSYSMCPVDFDDSLLEVLDPAALPSDWRQSPPPRSLQLIGDDWISRASSVVLRVPSAVVEDENNYLINPAHKDFKKLAIGRMKPFPLDARLTS